jgi:hypothetical protein
MATERRRLVVLGSLVVVLVGVLVKIWNGTSAAPAATSNRPVSSNAGRAQKPTPAPAPPSVHLDSLNGTRPKPESAERDLFRFKPKAPPAPPPAPPSQPAQPAPPVAPPGPSGPPPPAPIALKFIGLVESPTHGEKIAILSDGKNAPFYGREGAIIEGRYRILKIGVESVELAYVDGRGRQTIRLTGS